MVYHCLFKQNSLTHTQCGITVAIFRPKEIVISLQLGLQIMR